ncbi:MAG: agmatine deiminase family protein [Bacteroidales bacterium]|nr:agmatine deiminase family protein [Bacteroidales bacterium]
MTKVRKTLMFAVMSCFIFTAANAQINKAEQKQQRKQMLEINKQMTSEEINDYYNQMMQRKPNRAAATTLPTKSAEKSVSKKDLEVPEDMIFPIESDEVQAILIEWPYITRQKGTNNYAEAVFDGYGLVSAGYNYTVVETTSTPDVASSSNYAKLHGKLANSIQKHAQVWIDVWYDEDTVTIKNYMESLGTPLTNYKFFVHPGNSFWARDWGPVAFYYGDDDEIAFMDFEYYGGRPMDDQLPIQIAKDLGWKCYTNTIEYEGGNILVDGLGSLFTTSAVYETNQDSYGLYYLDTTGTTPQIGYYTKKSLTKQQVQDSIKHLMNLTNITVVPALQYDGGTGHIDLYADMWEEAGFVAAKYPEALATWTDAKRVESNIDSFTSKTNWFGNNYDVVRVPLPTKNNGSWYTNGTDYNRYTRCWANHTFVNDAIIQPVFYDTTKTGTSAGDVEGNKQALNVLKTAYPGYTFEEIDVRSFDGYGGAIHCITKQIPADNPVRIYHQPARWFNTQDNGSTYKLEVFSQNKSGISTVKVSYRLASEDSWKEITLTSAGNNKYTGEIALDANANNDTLFYYISSTSNNGKTITKPMTAHQGGYYIMPYGKDVNTYYNDYAYDTTITVGINTLVLEGISEIYPNPATDNATISVNNTNDLYYRIINLKGQVQQGGKIAKNTANYELDVKNLKTGNYWVIFTDGNLSTSRKLVIVK